MSFLTLPRFVVQHTPGKDRLYLVGLDECVTAVASVGADFGTPLAVALNDAVVGDLGNLDDLLAVQPSAVALACREALGGVSAPEYPYGIDYWGDEPIRAVPLPRYLSSVADLVEHLSTAERIDLGFRARNYRLANGDIEWECVLLTAARAFRYSEEARDWALPDGIVLAGTHRPSWSDAADLLANTQAQLTRIHLVWHAETEDLDGLGTTEWVVDVFDTPAPRAYQLS